MDEPIGHVTAVTRYGPLDGDRGRQAAGQHPEFAGKLGAVKFTGSTVQNKINSHYDQIGVEKRGHKPVPTAELVVRSQRGEGATPKGALQLRPLSCALWHRCPAGPAE